MTAVDDQIDLALALADECVSLHGPTRRERMVRLQGALCTFGFSRDVWIAAPQVTFRPSGLVIWNAPPLAVVVDVRSGNRLEGSVTPAGIPARWFALGDSFEQIAAKLDAGQQPPAWVTWSVVSRGTQIVIDLRSKDGEPLGPSDGIELCMWGTAAY